MKIFLKFLILSNLTLIGCNNSEYITDSDLDFCKPCCNETSDKWFKFDTTHYTIEFPSDPINHPYLRTRKEEKGGDYIMQSLYYVNDVQTYYSLQYFTLPLSLENLNNDSYIVDFFIKRINEGKNKVNAEIITDIKYYLDNNKYKSVIYSLKKKEDNSTIIIKLIQTEFHQYRVIIKYQKNRTDCVYAKKFINSFNLK